MTDQELVDAFIRERGVTHCPPAFAAETNHVVLSAETRAAHLARGIDPVGDAYRRKGSFTGWQRYWQKKRRVMA